MKRVSRAQLRGEKLDDDCKKANTTTNEFGKEDKDMTDWDIQKKCLDCKAYIGNITP